MNTLASRETFSCAGRYAFVGMGFQDRGDSFDFNVTLQDHFKYVKISIQTLPRYVVQRYVDDFKQVQERPIPCKTLVAW